MVSLGGRGSLSSGVSVQREGFLYRGVSVQGKGLCPGMTL